MRGSNTSQLLIWAILGGNKMIDYFDVGNGLRIIFRIVPILFVLIIFIILIVGIFGLKNIRKKKRNCTSKTYGKVKNIVKRTYPGDRTTTFHPVLEYNIGNLNFVKEYQYGSSICKYKIGQNIEIYYNPENYNEYYVAGDNTSIFLWIIFGVIGIVAIIFLLFEAIFFSFFAFLFPLFAF